MYQTCLGYHVKKHKLDQEATLPEISISIYICFYAESLSVNYHDISVNHQKI